MFCAFGWAKLIVDVASGLVPIIHQVQLDE